MPIPKIAVDRYLSRPLESLRWFKDLKPLDVEEELGYVNPPHGFRIPMRLDQKICFLLGVAHPEVVMMTDLGLGKTGVSLELLSYFHDNGFVRRAFVFAPTNEVAEGWEDEIRKWGFDLPFVRLSARSSAGKWEQLAKLDSGVVLGTYIGVAAMVSDLVPIRDERSNDTERRKREIVAESLTRALTDVDAVVFDQSTFLGSNKSLSYKVCKEFSAKAQVRFSLAGRAFGRDAFVLWSQFFLTDRGRALGRSPGMFREAFWRRQQSPWGVKWLIRKRREGILAEMITASSIRYASDECLDLPPKVSIVKECAFPDENWRYYDRVRDELLSAKGNWREVRNAFLRMRQISSGFVGFIDDDTGERAQIEFEHNPKLDLLLELIDEVPDDRKMVIFHEFTWSGARICQELTKAKRPHGWLWSGTKDWTRIKEAFNDDPDFRILVANHRKGSMGLNLQAASYLFMYESPVSAIGRYEAEGRIYRSGQKHRSFIFDVTTKNSADQKILEFHRDAKDLYHALVENPTRLFGRKDGKR